MPEYKVCIKAAGAGSRITAAKYTHKALLPLDNKTILSHIIEKFPEHIEIVIPVGHRARLIRDFAAISYPNRKITFVNVDRYRGDGSGPGYSLLCCKDYLQCPFIFVACDTLVLDTIPRPDHNWIGISTVSDSKNYLIADVQDGNVKQFFDKPSDEPESNTLDHAFIGLAGIKDHQSFWRGLCSDQTLTRGERQVSNGLKALIPKGLKAVPFQWFDTGTNEHFEYAKKRLSKNETVPKKNEFIYFENKKVIKFFSEPNRVSARVQRAKILKNVVPPITDHKANFYAYRHVSGTLLSKNLDREIFLNFLKFCQNELWTKTLLQGKKAKAFKQACRSFYVDKTKERHQAFLQTSGISANIIHKPIMINGLKVPPLGALLDSVPWGSLCEGIPTRIHGDLQPENVIVAERLVNKSKFCLIDWREDFGGIQEYGDIYYDFAKLYHALIISHEIIRKKEYQIIQNKNNVEYHFLLKSNLWEFKSLFEHFLKQEGYDLFKVKLLSALIYINICPLHTPPYSFLLYYFGRHMLYTLLGASENRGVNIVQKSRALSPRADRDSQEFPNRKRRSPGGSHISYV